MKRLQDIADQVGVSRTTVSNVLHGNTKKVSKEMIRKISEILNQEAYVAIVTGAQPIDYFDTFVSEWKRLGGDAIAQEVQEYFAQ